LKTETATTGITVHRIRRIPTYKKMGPGPSFQKLLILDPLLGAKVWQVSEKIDFDVIHGHSFEGLLAALPTARIRKKRLIYDAHSTLIGELPSYGFVNIKWLMKFFDRKVPAAADHILAVSKSLKEFLVKGGQPEEGITIVPTGVNVRQFEGHDPERKRKEFGIPERIPIVMYTGSLANFQGVDFLVNAMKKVLGEMPDAVLMLIGNSNVEKYRNMCKTLGIEDRVIMTGEKPFEEIPLFIACADVLVSPRIECPGIPQKISNYMAAGKAIVSFEGSAKLLVNNENGLVVSNGDTAKMATAIILLLTNEGLRTKLGQDAKKTILEKYDWGTLSRQVEKVYSDLLCY